MHRSSRLSCKLHLVWFIFRDSETKGAEILTTIHSKIKLLSFTTQLHLEISRDLSGRFQPVVVTDLSVKYETTSQALSTS